MSHIIPQHGKDIEKRIVQMKLVEEEEKRKHQIKMEKLRHQFIMEELKFMADNKINVFNRYCTVDQPEKNNKP